MRQTAGALLLLSVAAAVTLRADEPAPALRDVLARTAAYVAAFERALSGIVAEEQYTQQVRYPPRFPQMMNMDRRLRSDLLLVKPRGAGNWLQFRDVYEVDGRPVRDRDQRLVRLFVDPPESVDAQVAAIMRESSRYNIGALLRTVNTPLLPLFFLEAANQPRFKFSRTDQTRPSAATEELPAPPGHFRLQTEVWTVEYRERKSDTMVRTAGMRDLPARGRFWIEPATGRVLMSELILENRTLRGAITVNYQSEPLLDVLVPTEMRERYDKVGNQSTIDGFATYGKFRQVQVRVDETPGSIKK